MTMVIDFSISDAQFIDIPVNKENRSDTVKWLALSVIVNIVLLILVIAKL